jgi:hypothetical protein
LFKIIIHDASANLSQRFELRSHIRKLGRKPTTAQKLELAKKRRGLRNRITSFAKTALQYLGQDAIDGIYETEQIILEEDVSEDEEADEENPTISAADPERQLLPLPSTVPDGCLRELPPDRWSVIGDLRNIELSIRKGHGADALEQVRTAMIHLSWQYKNILRTATSGVQKTRAWDKIKLLNHTWKLQRRVYNQNRIVMINLGEGTGVAGEYPFLDIKDCTVSTTITNRNSAGQSSDRLPWFMASFQGSAAAEGEHENECKVLPPLTSTKLIFIQVYRVNWLRARSQNNRWEEELALTKHEMEWTVRWYVHMAGKWRARRDADDLPSAGHRAYAEKQMAMWNELGRVSEVLFSNTNPAHPSVWQLVE